MANTVTRLTANGVYQSSGGFDEVSLNSGSIYFNSVAPSYFQIGTTNSFVFTGDFTIEGWIYKTTTGNQYFASTWNNGTVSLCSWAFGVSAGSPAYATFAFGIGASTPTVTGTTQPITLNQWTHVAVVRSGTTITLYVNGKADATTGTSSGTLNTPNQALYLGVLVPSLPLPFNGYLSNFRITTSSIYSNNFTPLNSPLLPVANTSLLLATKPQNPFVDSSINNFVSTGKSGNPQFNTFGPFYYPANTSINLANTNNNPILGTNTNIISSTTSNGVVMISNEFDEVSMSSGSLYFNGSSYVSVSDNTTLQFGTGDLTVEAWVYRTGAPGNSNIASKGNGTSSGWTFYLASAGSYVAALGIAGTSNFMSGTTILNTNTWYHVAWTRSGSTNRLFVNGILEATATDSTNFGAGDPLNIAANRSNAATLIGNLSNIRIIKGTALYTSNFTRPQTALLPITNTSLLLNNFAGEPFVDNSLNNFTITGVGTPSANTLSPFANTQQKVLNTGTMLVKEFDEVSTTAGSIYLNGSSYLTTSDSSSLAFGTGDLTIECWVYPTNIQPVVSGMMGSGSTATANTWQLGIQSTSTCMAFTYTGSTSLVGSTIIQTNKWYHVAVTRTAGTVRLFLNGQQENSIVNTTDYNETSLKIGTARTSVNYFSGGNISNIRIIKGTSLYSANFAPPMMALSSVSNTALLLNNFQAEPFVDNGPNIISLTPVGSPIFAANTPFV